MRNNKISKTAVALLGATMALGLTACGGGAEPADGDNGGGGASGGQSITLSFVPSWTDGRSVGHLVKYQLEEAGYEVDIQDLSEVGPIYTALAQGDVDMYPSAWPEVTHVQYMEKLGDKIEDLGAYYDNAKLTWAVPEYSKINSIEDIKEHADVLDNKIIGIEPGAGLTKASQESVLPEYGLDSFELVTSSTAGMLSELKTATDAEEEIVVTLWRPFWANSEFGMRDLEDPKGALGEAEALHFLGKKGFAEEFPKVAEWVGSIEMSDEVYGSLEDTVVNQFAEGEEEEAIKQWLAENPDAVPAFEG